MAKFLPKPKDYDKEAVERYLKQLFAKANKTYKQDTLGYAMGYLSRDVAGKHLRGAYPNDKHFTLRHLHNILAYLGLAKDGEEFRELYRLVTGQASDPTTNTAHLLPCPANISETLYYYELELAEPAPARHTNGSDARSPSELRHLSAEVAQYGAVHGWHKPQAASKRFAQLTQQHNDAVCIILGEPGGGKTTLLSKWTTQAYDDYQHNDTLPYPFYVRLRDLDNPTDKNTALQDYAKRHSAPSTDAIAHHLSQSQIGKARTLWLFDGFDEVASEARSDWQRYITSLPGTKIVSCRVLRYHQDFPNAQQYLIYGLDRKQQKEYLHSILPSLQKRSAAHAEADATWVENLLRALHSPKHQQLRQLCLSPLLLRLIAESNPPNAINLPNTRSQFYTDAVEAMLRWDGRLPQGPARQERLTRSLAAIAKQAGLEFSISSHVLLAGIAKEYEEDKVDEALNNLLKSGIVREVSPNTYYGRKHYEFMHATFHEWAYAQALASSGESLQQGVARYWRNPSYDEVLALLWGHSTISDDAREEATRWLMQAGCQPRSDNKQRWRSGLKESLLMWERAGMPMPETLQTTLWEQVKHKPELRLALAATTLSQQVLLTKLSEYADGRWWLARNPNLSPELMAQLVKDDNEWVRRWLAQHPNLSPEAMAQLVEDDDEWVRRWLAQHPNLSPELMAQLAKDDDADVRRWLAQHPNLSPELMAQLAKDDDAEVCRWLARNPNLSPELMAQFAKDDDADVRWRLARNPNLSPELMAQFAKDDDEWVRRWLAQHPNLSPELMAQFAKDDDADVRRWLAQHPNLSPEAMAQLAKDDDAEVCRWLARNPNLSPELMAQFAKDDDADVRRWLAQHPNLSPELMAQFAKDDDEWVRRLLARNPNLSPEAMAQLAEDDDAWVRRWLAQNPNVCWEVFLDS